MSTLVETLQSNFGYIVGMILLVVAGLTMVRWVAGRYRKASPSTALIKYGRKHKVKIPQADGSVHEETLGFLPVVGGGTIVWPILEEVTELHLGQRTIPFDVASLPTKDRVPVTVNAVALVHISSQMEHLIAAAQKYEDMDDTQINDTLKTVLEGQLRSILGKMTIEELINDREVLAKAVFDIAENEMRRLGIQIDSLNILTIKDDKGYIDSLGVKRIAEVKRDADIGKAEAEREAAVRVAEADRLGKAARMAADAQIAEAERDLNKKKADYDAEVAAARARSEQAGPLATAEAEKAVRLARVAVETTETEARVGLAQQEKTRREAELQATVITQAEADRKTAVIAAEALQQQSVIKAEADRKTAVIAAEAGYETAAKKAEAVRIQAEADAAATAKKGEGDAAATRARLTAEADGNKAKQLAEAAGTEARGMAEAKSTEARLLAEATGKEKLAAALALLDDTGKTLQVMEELPLVITAIGDALTKALGKDGAAQIFAAVAAPLGEIDNVNIVDLGGSNGNGHSPLNKLPNTVLKTVFDTLANAKALGLDELLSKFGVDVPTLLQNLGSASSTPRPPAQS